MRVIFFLIGTILKLGHVLKIEEENIIIIRYDIIKKSAIVSIILIYFID